jgi:hypothetical protein
MQRDPGDSGCLVAASASEWIWGRTAARPFDGLRAPSVSRGWRSQLHPVRPATWSLDAPIEGIRAQRDEGVASP